MSLLTFRDDPWLRSHPAYQISPFNIRPAPEFATAEVVVASLYRAVGFPDRPERDVPSAGRDFDRASQIIRPRQRAQNSIGGETWRAILQGVLQSPKQPNQSSRRFLQLCPVVPDVALYSGSARLTGSSWNPGQLVQRMIQLGSVADGQAGALWKATYDGLSIQDGDDIWARWLQLEFESRRRGSIDWEHSPGENDATWAHTEKLEVRFPAKQFCRDLDAILLAKEHMTRRQWVSLLEAICRLGTVAHMLWLSDVNARIWSTVKSILEGEEPPQDSDIVSRVLDCSSPFLEYGNAAVPIIRDCASRYLVARLGLNLILWHLEGAGIKQKGLNSSADIGNLFRACKQQREALAAAEVLREFNDLKDEQARTIICKKGIGSNLIEFGRHALGQRQTNDDSLRGYDQGYILRKRSEQKSSPWIVSLGPVALLALTHCCLRDAAGPRSVQRLCAHLGLYGINVDQDDVSKGDLGRKLRMLGLVYDSPDAESGMLLVSPFDGSSRKDL